jgi:hypothetical protein
VLEAYQIEMDYGTSSEWYRQTLQVEGQEGTREYNMLRVGRVGLYFQSDDAGVTGYYDPDQGAFVTSGDYRSEIRKGVRMARQLIAPEIILVPVQAAEPVGETS